MYVILELVTVNNRRWGQRPDFIGYMYITSDWMSRAKRFTAILDPQYFYDSEEE